MKHVQHKKGAPEAESHSNPRNTFIQRKTKQEEEEETFVSKDRAFLQPKLTIGSPNDPYEQEADRMADYIMRQPSIGSSPPMISRLPLGRLQRRCADCERNEEGIIQRKCAKCEAGKNGLVQRKEERIRSLAPNDLSHRLQNRRGSGTPLATNVRQQMERSFGTDFSGVRVHTDAEAVQMSQDLGAHAFTHGRDVYFNQGRYHPESTQGKRLLGHELTHVVQQRGYSVLQKDDDQSSSSESTITSEVPTFEVIATNAGFNSHGQLTTQIGLQWVRRQMSVGEAARGIADQEASITRSSHSTYQYDHRWGLFLAPWLYRNNTSQAWQNQNPSGRGWGNVGRIVRPNLRPRSPFQQAFQGSFSNSQTIENPTGPQILSSIQQNIVSLQEIIANSDESAELVVYFEGHGGVGGICGVDERCVEPSELQELAVEAQRSGIHLTFILDSCNMGEFVSYAFSTRLENLRQRYGESREINLLIQLADASGWVNRRINELYDLRRQLRRPGPRRDAQEEVDRLLSNGENSLHAELLRISDILNQIAPQDFDTNPLEFNSLNVRIWLSVVETYVSFLESRRDRGSYEIGNQDIQFLREQIFPFSDQLNAFMDLLTHNYERRIQRNGEVNPPTTPEPEVPTTPEPEVPTTPEPETPTTPEPEVPTTPEPEVPTTPEPEVPTTPEPEVPSGFEREEMPGNQIGPSGNSQVPNQEGPWSEYFSNGIRLCGYGNDSAEISPIHRTQIQQFLENYIGNTSRVFLIEGHTSSFGSLAYNYRLSRIRARNIRRLLIQMGISPNQIRTIGFGESDLLVDDSAGTGVLNQRLQARNRRVEIRYMSRREARIRGRQAPTPSMHSRRGIRTRRRQIGDSQNQESLRLVAREGLWLVFNRPAFRPEVIDYIWGDRFSPNHHELYARNGTARTDEGLMLEMGSTHWALPRTRFAIREGVFQQMRPAVRRQIAHLPSIQSGQRLSRPSWIPQDVWQQFRRSRPGIYRYRNRSEMHTDIILIHRENGQRSGYVEAPTDLQILYRQMQVAPPSLVRRLLGGETSEQARVRWLAEANRGYNDYMHRQIQAGIDPYDASRNYRDDVYQAYIRAFVSAVGFMGSGSPSVASVPAPRF